MVVILFFYLTLIRPIQKANARLTTLKAIAAETKAAAKDQDLPLMQANVKKLQSEVALLKKDIRFLYLYKYTPFVGFMLSDAGNGLEAATYLLSAADQTVAAIEPYADLLGFKKGTEFADQPTEKRLETAILTIDKLVPKVDGIEADLEQAKVYLARINPDRYPAKLGKKVVRERVRQVYDQVFDGLTLAIDAKPLFKRLPYILGKDEERKYLVLFLNDAELRPTGGFITAYAIFSVDRGKITVKESSDIYELDNTLASHPRAPREILTYHKGVSTFNVRDSNLSPDYPKSIEYFEELMERSSRNLDYDGIISIDTQVLVRTLEILGPTEANGITFNAEVDPRCDCPQAIYELENEITRPVGYLKEARKSILSVLLYNLMQKALGVSPSQYWGPLMSSYIGELEEKHILVNFKDQASQKAMESLNFAGRVQNFDGDYLHINNTNFAGAKSNMYLKYKVESHTERKGDKYFRELTLEYRNIYPASDCNEERGGLCLNAPLRNWLRVYVPKGARLVSFVGSQREVQEYEELGKQVFEGYMTVNPLGKAVVKVSYEIPASVIDGKEYRLLVQKQPGIDEMEMVVGYGKEEQFDTLIKDTTYVF